MIQPKPKKKIVKKKTPHPNDNYKGMVDPATGKKGTMGGEGTRPPFTAEERRKMPRVGSMGSGKNGKTIKKAKSGTSLGMKSVKSGYDNNSGVTRADFVAIGKGKAKNGTAMMKMGGKTTKKMQYGGKAALMVPPKKRTMKMGGTVKKAFLGKMLGGAGKSMIGGLAGKALSGLIGKNVPAKNGKSMKKCKYGCK